MSPVFSPPLSPSIFCIVYPWDHSPLVSNVPSLPHWVSFQVIGTGSDILGYHPCWCPSSFPLRLPYVCVFSISPAIGFNSCFFFTTNISAHIRSTLHLLDGEFPGLGLSLAFDVVV